MTASPDRRPEGSGGHPAGGSQDEPESGRLRVTARASRGTSHGQAPSHPGGPAPCLRRTLAYSLGRVNPTEVTCADATPILWPGGVVPITQLRGGWFWGEG